MLVIGGKKEGPSQGLISIWRVIVREGARIHKELEPKSERRTGAAIIKMLVDILTSTYWGQSWSAEGASAEAPTPLQGPQIHGSHLPCSLFIFDLDVEYKNLEVRGVDGTIIWWTRTKTPTSYTAAQQVCRCHKSLDGGLGPQANGWIE